MPNDLEPVGQIIPRVFDAAADAALVQQLKTALPAPPEPQRDTLTIHAITEHRLPWPPNLHSRLVAAREAVQCLDLDEAIALLLELTGDIDRIERTEERIALRHRPERG